jgi:peptidylprolyl isomerase
MRRSLAASAVAALLVAGTAACSSDSPDSSKASDSSSADTLTGLKVTGAFGKEAKVAVDGLNVDKPQSQELITGDGAEVTADSYVLYRVEIANGKDGKELQSNFDDPQAQQMVVGKVQPLIKDAVVGTHIGSRVAIAAPVEELVGQGQAAQVGMTATDDVVLVLDLVDEGQAPLSGPDGQTVQPPADAPKVVGDDEVTGIDFTDAPAKAPKAAKDFEVIPLIDGKGPAIKEGDSVTVNYFGAVWGKGDAPFDESYSQDPATFTLAKGQLIDGWVKGLQGVKLGSRVMLIVPPSLGYGAQGGGEDIPPDSTLVFVIDVLGIA